ncbi:hypothetical protein M1L60_26800 [Actinoplanes sp. TRM 88003]|uniref:Uncharacterized protein n=1 Tax=Paractinoplanes aksuensis TaxID=2939490 RepID=A0ABT1DTR7_9ACTN|nr:hypothetical protein [Actinoplanes aksuensis]MCO8274215.1 hypothetical protein [Actinoplanes aksuensis]
MIKALLAVLLLCEAGLAYIGGQAWSTLHEDGGISGLVLLGATGAAGVLVMVALLLGRTGLGTALAWLRLAGVFIAGAVLVAVGELTPGFGGLLALFDALLGVVLAGFVRRGR